MKTWYRVEDGYVIKLEGEETPNDPDHWYFNSLDCEDEHGFRDLEKCCLPVKDLFENIESEASRNFGLRAQDR